MTSARGSALIAVLVCSMLALPACARDAPSTGAAPVAAASAAPSPGPAGTAGAQAQSLRKVVRTATLSLEVSSVERAHAQAIAVAEGRGGYVTTANRVESKSDGAGHESSSLVLRVPGQHMTSVLAELRRLSAGSVSEQIGSEDVTDEFVDTEARLRNHRRLEEQLLELLKTASNVEGALKVHQELANVRGEVERLEGRRQFLDRETTWATINLAFSELPVAQVTDGFLSASFGRAKRDALAVGEGIIVSAIRMIGVLLPIIVLLFLPLVGLLLGIRRLVLRRQARHVSAQSA